MTTITTTPEKHVERASAHVATGAAAAAFIASGIGVFVLGLMTTGAEVSSGLKNILNWWNPAGPLSGKTGVAILAWIISWLVLNHLWRGEDKALRSAFTITMVLVGLGVLLTFPPFFTAFE